jgi:hypothetical protein
MSRSRCEHYTSIIEEPLEPQDNVAVALAGPRMAARWSTTAVSSQTSRSPFSFSCASRPTLAERKRQSSLTSFTWDAMKSSRR